MISMIYAKTFLQAGIPYLDNITIEDVTNEKEIMKIMEQAVPLWKPGTATGSIP